MRPADIQMRAAHKLLGLGNNLHSSSVHVASMRAKRRIVLCKLGSLGDLHPLNRLLATATYDERASDAGRRVGRENGAAVACDTVERAMAALCQSAASG